MTVPLLVKSVAAVRLAAVTALTVPLLVRVPVVATSVAAPVRASTKDPASNVPAVMVTLSATMVPFTDSLPASRARRLKSSPLATKKVFRMPIALPLPARLTDPPLTPPLLSNVAALMTPPAAWLRAPDAVKSTTPAGAFRISAAVITMPPAFSVMLPAPTEPATVRLPPFFSAKSPPLTENVASVPTVFVPLTRETVPTTPPLLRSVPAMMVPRFWVMPPPEVLRSSVPPDVAYSTPEADSVIPPLPEVSAIKVPAPMLPVIARPPVPPLPIATLLPVTGPLTVSDVLLWIATGPAATRLPTVAIWLPLLTSAIEPTLPNSVPTSRLPPWATPPAVNRPREVPPVPVWLMPVKSILSPAVPRLIGPVVAAEPSCNVPVFRYAARLPLLSDNVLAGPPGPEETVIP